MKLGLIPQNFVEWLALKLNLVPEPLADTMVSFITARTIMVATKLNIFEVLATDDLTFNGVAQKCNTNPFATLKLLNALVGIGYLKITGHRYSITQTVKKWLLKENDMSLYYKMLSNDIDWQVAENFEKFIRTGNSIDFHRDGYLSEKNWSLYQRGLRSLSSVSAKEVARKIPVPKGALNLLDIGGAHGFYSVSICRLHKNLNATILELEEAAKVSKPILDEEEMGLRVQHLPCDALKYDFEENYWDVVFLSNFIHHLDKDLNNTLINRIFKSLRSNGVLTILEPIRPVSSKEIINARLGAIMDLFFAVSSKSGTWTIEEITGWQLDAGFRVKKPIWIRSMPGFAMLSAVKTL